MAEDRHVKVALFSQKQVRRVLLDDDIGTKHSLAEMIAGRFPEELDFLLPRKRRIWESEGSRMNLFDALALALMVTKRG